MYVGTIATVVTNNAMSQSHKSYWKNNEEQRGK